MVASDPANVYTLPLAAGAERDPLGAPRGVGAMLVTLRGRIIMSAVGRGSRSRVREGVSSDEVRGAARALAARLVQRTGAGRRRDVLVDTIDGEPAGGTRWSAAFVDAGFRAMGRALRFLG